MPILTKLKEFLDGRKTSYEVYNHPTAFTAQEIAASQHVHGRELAKVVILKVDGDFVMAVLPASRLVNLEKVRAAVGAEEIALATEAEFARLFPGCEIGAMPPFGNLFGLPVYVDAELELDKAVFFNAGNHQQTVRLRYRDFKRLAQPAVFSMTVGRRKRAA
jgi:Ala-tRNA(Pro) deacylase